VVTKQGDAEQAAFGEHYRFEKRADGWRLVHYEYWPLMPDTLEEFGAGRFALLDAEADEARAHGNDRLVAYYLMAAYRFDECAQVARRLTDHTPEQPWVSARIRASRRALTSCGTATCPEYTRATRGGPAASKGCHEISASRLDRPRRLAHLPRLHELR
jgi:hypothetical protein